MQEHLNRFVRFLLATEKLEKAVQKTKNVCMSGIGLRGGYVMCLCQLRRHKEGITAASLARTCEVDRAFISRTLSELTDAGCVEQKSINGTRRTLITLTEKGEELASRMEGMASAAVRVATEGIDSEDIETFYRVIGQMEKNLTSKQDDIPDAQSKGDASLND